MTDFELARAFFGRLKERGFGVELEDWNGEVIPDGKNPMEWDGAPPQNVSFNLLDAHGKAFACFDFCNDGSFHRISATDSTGWYGDEVDLRKY